MLGFPTHVGAGFGVALLLLSGCPPIDPPAPASDHSGEAYCEPGTLYMECGGLTVDVCIDADFQVYYVFSDQTCFPCEADNCYRAAADAIDFCSDQSL